MVYYNCFKNERYVVDKRTYSTKGKVYNSRLHHCALSELLDHSQYVVKEATIPVSPLANHSNTGTV